MMTFDHSKVLDWLTKDHPTTEYWKNIGKEMYLASNGDSALTRHRLADALRRSISKLQPGPVKYDKWNDDFSAVIEVEIEAPEISASNDAYVDWLRLADYLLLPASSSWAKLEDDNQRRRAMYDQARRGYEARMIVKAVVAYMKENPTATDKDVQAALSGDGRDVLQIHVAQAKKVIPASGGREIEERAPEAPVEINRYSPLYF